MFRASVARRRSFVLRSACEPLESRTLLTSTLYIDYGDRFAGGALATTVGALDSTADGGNPNIDGPVLSDSAGNDYAAGTAVTINSVNALYGAGAAALRATMTALAQRFYEPFDITVVELTANFQNVNGNNVRAAANLNEISQILGANEGAAENNDSYIIVGQFLIGASNDNPAVFATNGYGGLSTGTDIGGYNNNDGTAFVTLIGSGDGAQFNGAQIAHEAGHAFGLEHVYRQNTGSPPAASITNTTATGAQYDQLHQSELMSYLGYATQGGFNVFSRYPMMDGDGNTDANVLASNPGGILTMYDQFITDPSIGPSNINYVTGTGTNDIITITNAGGGLANVSVQAFADAGYTTTIDAPGATGNTYSYTISLDRPLTIDAGGRNDRIILDGDLGVTINLRGMHGTDELIVMGKNAASATYTTGTNNTNGLDNQSDLRGSVSIGSTVINFQEFEDAGKVTIQDVSALTYRTGGSNDSITLDSPAAGRMRLDGTTGVVPQVAMEFFNVGALTIDTGTNDGASANDTVLIASNAVAAGLNSVTVNTGAGGDLLDVNFAVGNAIPAGGLSFDAGAGADPTDRLNLRGGNFATEVYTPSGAHSGSIVLGGSTTITYANTASISDTVTVPAMTFNASSNADIINLVDSTPFNSADTTQINSGNGTFELVNFANKATVRVQGQNGADTFNVSGTDPADGLNELILHGEDQANTADDNAGDTFNLTAAFPGIPTRAFGGGGGDTFNFTGSGAGVGSTVFLNGEAGNDRFDVTASANAPLTVSGGGDFDILAVDGDAASFIVTNTTFTSAGLQTITYSTVERLELTDGTFEVSGVVSTPFHVNNAATLIGTGTAAGGITVSTGGTVSPGIAGPGVLGSGNLLFTAGTYTVDINGTTPGTDHDQLNVTGTVNLGAGVATLSALVNYGSVPGDEVVIIRNDGADATLGFFAGAPQGAIFDFGGGQKFTIDYGFEADSDGNFNDVALIRYGAALAPDPCEPGKMALFVSATATHDVIQLIPDPGNKTIEVLINGVDEGTFRPDGGVFVMAQNGDDHVISDMPSREVVFYGNAGNDTLESGNSDSILIGGWGDDLLRSGNAKDLLIGGRGADVLESGNGTDILIAGYTDYDVTTNAARMVLCDIREAWHTGGKVADVAGWLNAATMHDDSEVDRLISGKGSDWLVLNTTGGTAIDQHDASGPDILTDIT